ncbi:MAG: mechanosensitive ion channel [Anaerolineales bacterium]
MPEYFNQLLEKAVASLPNVLTAILIFVASLYVAKLLSNLLKQVLLKREADREVTMLLGKITRWSIIVAGIITALQRFFDVTAFLTGLGILGFTIGFALQNIMQNFVSGIILLIEQPFDVGDAVELNSYGGAILSINLRTTEMRTFEGLIVMIPNADVLSNTITNYTRAARRRIELPVGVSYGSDPAVTRQTVLEAIKNIPGFLGDPEPMVVFHTFGGSSVDMSAYFWIDTSKTNPFAAKDAALELIKGALEKKGIEIPFPITTVYLQSES